MPDLTELDAKVREARKLLRLNFGLALAGCGMGEADCKEGIASIDALISAVRTHERARCRQAVEGEDTEYLDTDWARGVSAAIHDALAAIDALEG